MALVDVTIVPIGTNTTSISEYVADIIKVLNTQNTIKYELTPMGTVLEGDLNEILELIKIMHEVPFEKGQKRVSTIIKIDDRRDKKGTISQKLNSVKSKL